MRSFILKVVLIASISVSGILNAQDSSVKDEPKYGVDSAECVKQLSVYNEYYKQNLYKEAYPSWKYVMVNCPKASKNTFIRGIKMVETKMEQTSDENLKKSLVDTLLLVYDRRIIYWGEDGSVLGTKGIDIMKYQNDPAAAYEVFKKSIAIEGNNTHYNTLYYTMLAVIKLIQSEKIDKLALIETYDMLSAIAEYNIKNGHEKAENYKASADNIEKMAAPFMSCEDLVDICTKKFQEIPENTDMLKKATQLLEKKGCDKSDIYFEMTKQLIKLEPTAESALLGGKMSISREKWSDAVKYLEQAVDLFTKQKEENPELDLTSQLADAYYYLAFAFKENGSSLNARSYAYKNLELQPNNGKSYILIGMLYAASAGSCGEGEVHGKAAYWAAIDKFYKAKSVDESVSEQANGLIGAYSARFPNKEDLFFYNIKDGDSYKVECWINETTTVRSR